MTAAAAATTTSRSSHRNHHHHNATEQPVSQPQQSSPSKMIMTHKNNHQPEQHPPEQPPQSSPVFPSSSTDCLSELQQPRYAQQAWQTHGIVLNKTRICHPQQSNEMGTIVYVGPVASSSLYPHQLYIGVIWDNFTSGPGKHNGTVLRKKQKQKKQEQSSKEHSTSSNATTSSTWVQHFCCPHPQGASFLKLTPQLQLGKTLDLALLQQLYVPPNAALVAPQQILTYMPIHRGKNDTRTTDAPADDGTDGKKNDSTNNHHPSSLSSNKKKTQIPIELYGETKIRQRQQLGYNVTRLGLRRCAIARIGGAGGQNDTTDDSNSSDAWSIPATETTNEDDHTPPPTTTTMISVVDPVTKVDLAGNLLSDWHQVAKLFSIFRNIQELSLAANRLMDWPVEQDEGEEQQQQQFTSTASPSAFPVVPYFPKLTWLNLKSCHISSLSHTLLPLGKALPNLTTLCLADNPLQLQVLVPRRQDSQDSTPLHNNHDNDNDDDHDAQQQQEQQLVTIQQSLATAFGHLQSLDISQCRLSSPRDMTVWASLPQLAHLDLDDNPLTELPRKGLLASSNNTRRNNDTDEMDEENNNDTTALWFPRLHQIQLCHTSIASWSALEGLRDLPSLSSIKFQSTPLGQAEGPATTRCHIIARFEQLTTIQSSPVSPQERLDAERRYVATITRYLATQYPLAQTKDTNILCTKGPENDQCHTAAHEQNIARAAFIAEHHPTYEALCRKHAIAAAAAAQNGSMTNGLLSDSLLSITIQSLAAQSCEKPPLVRRLPQTLTIQKMKALLSRHFGLDIDLQVLTVANTTNAGVPTPLDQDDCDLAYFGVRDGATIYMQERDVSSLAHSADEDEAAELLERVQLQEAQVYDFMERQKQANR